MSISSATHPHQDDALVRPADPTPARVSRRGLLGLAGGMAAAGIVGAAAPAAGATGTTGTRVPRLVQQWANAWNTGSAEALAALFTKDGTYTDHAFQASFRGREAIGQWVVITLDSIASARVTIHDAFRTQNRAAARWTCSGTFTSI